MNKIMTAIVTPTWNNEEYTIRCFDSIQKNTQDYKIIWIDNGSEKKSKKKVWDFLDKNKVPYELIENERNLGFVKATNQGMKRAMEIGVEYIVLQNNDTEVYTDWLDKMIIVANNDSDIGLVGPITSPCTSWQSIQNIGKRIEFVDLPKYKNNPIKYSKIISEKYAGEIVEIKRSLAFFSTLIKREVVQDIGFLSENYGVGLCDDDDYCARAFESGWRICLAKDVFVFHNHRTTFKSIYSKEEIDDMQKNNFATFKKKNSEFVRRINKNKFLHFFAEKIKFYFCKMKMVVNKIFKQ